ncbi:hypothetical protein K461DRAFT_278314 [Myriangium duriaei CBS 260.36]|uniref:PSI domain-containing protein n=1 Tax=Myriangium duriaei CBS 260.36 TaxID=1168546 RepID=A0A9P4J116_9PEZI|nr:hypothetical protein K461DRAFT_278314 [Myriangium duriaei CBS 260.36]
MVSYDKHLAQCWRIQDCNSCIRSTHSCGWCPNSHGCVPVTTLFDPVRNPDICPHWAERWELRTKALGCGCSTLTLLAVLITIVCTIAGLVILLGLYKVVVSMNRVWGFGALGGHYLELDDDNDNDRREGIWLRSRWWLPKWIHRRINLEDAEDETRSSHPGYG